MGGCNGVLCVCLLLCFVSPKNIRSLDTRHALNADTYTVEIERGVDVPFMVRVVSALDGISHGT